MRRESLRCVPRGTLLDLLVFRCLTKSRVMFHVEHFYELRSEGNSSRPVSSLIGPTSHLRVPYALKSTPRDGEELSAGRSCSTCHFLGSRSVYLSGYICS